MNIERPSQSEPEPYESEPIRRIADIGSLESQSLSSADLLEKANLMSDPELVIALSEEGESNPGNRVVRNALRETIQRRKEKGLWDYEVERQINESWSGDRDGDLEDDVFVEGLRNEVNGAVWDADHKNDYSDIYELDVRLGRYEDKIRKFREQIKAQIGKREGSS